MDHSVDNWDEIKLLCDGIYNMVPTTKESYMKLYNLVHGHCTYVRVKDEFRDSKVAGRDLYKKLFGFLKAKVISLRTVRCDFYDLYF